MATNHSKSRNLSRRPNLNRHLYENPVCVVVSYDFEYVAEEGKRVWIKEGEILLLINKTNYDWWQVIRNGDRRPFFAPAKYVVELLRSNNSDGRSKDGSTLRHGLWLKKQQQSFTTQNRAANNNRGFSSPNYPAPRRISTSNQHTYSRISNSTCSLSTFMPPLSDHTIRQPMTVRTPASSSSSFFSCQPGSEMDGDHKAHVANTSVPLFGSRMRCNSLDSILVVADLDEKTFKDSCVWSKKSPSILSSKSFSVLDQINEINTGRAFDDRSKFDGGSTVNLLAKRPTFEAGLDKRNSWSIDVNYSAFTKQKHSHQNVRELGILKKDDSLLSGEGGQDFSKKKRPIPAPRSRIPVFSRVSVEPSSIADNKVPYGCFKRSKTDLGLSSLDLYRTGFKRLNCHMGVNYPAPRVPRTIDASHPIQIPVLIDKHTVNLSEKPKLKTLLKQDPSFNSNNVINRVLSENDLDVEEHAVVIEVSHASASKIDKDKVDVNSIVLDDLERVEQHNRMSSSVDSCNLGGSNVNVVCHISSSRSLEDCSFDSNDSTAYKSLFTAAAVKNKSDSPVQKFCQPNVSPKRKVAMLEWDECEDDESGRTYYFNTITKEKSWKPPRKSKSCNNEGGYSTLNSPESSDVNENTVTLQKTEEVETPNGYERKLDNETGFVHFVNVFTGVRWYTALDAGGKAYYYEENGNESCWSLPRVSHSIQDNSSSTSDKAFQIGSVQIVIVKQGPLQKTKIFENGRKVRKCWMKSHAVLTETFLLFFKDIRSFSIMMQSASTLTAKPDICVDLKGAIVARCVAGQKSKKINVFEITTVLGMTVLLQDDSALMAEEWFVALERIINGRALAKPLATTPFTRTKSMKLKKIFGNRNSDEASSSSTSKSNIREKLRNFFLRRPTMDELFRKGILRNEPVFGSSLCELSQSTENGGMDSVPAFVRKCLELIERNDLLCTDGVYRQSGNLSHVQRIRLQVNAGNLNILDRVDDVHVLTGALKLFFRELREPLLPWDCVQLLRKSKKPQEIKEALNQLPIAHRSTLQVLLRHLLKVTEFTLSNRMQIPNLAIIFGPTLMWPPRDIVSNNLALEMMHQNIVMESLLTNYYYIF